MVRRYFCDPRKNSCLRDAFVCFLWHTSRHQSIAVIGGRCRSRADNLQPRTVEAGSVMPCVCVCVCVLPCRQVWRCVVQSLTGWAAELTVWMSSPAPHDVDVWRHHWRHRPDDELPASSVDHTHTQQSVDHTHSGDDNELTTDIPRDGVNKRWVNLLRGDFNSFMCHSYLPHAVWETAALTSVDLTHIHNNPTNQPMLTLTLTIEINEQP